MFCERSKVLIGGYTPASQPRTSCPPARASWAMPAMKVPQIPAMKIFISLAPIMTDK